MSFEGELKTLMVKYNVTIQAVDHYSNEEEYTGTGYYFKVGKNTILADKDNYILPIEDLFDEQ